MARCRFRAENPRSFLERGATKDVSIHLALIIQRLGGEDHALFNEILGELETRLDDLEPDVAYQVLKFCAFRHKSWLPKLVVHSVLTGEMRFGDLKDWLEKSDLPPAEFEPLIAKGGYAKGLAAVIQRNTKLANEILAGADTEAITAVLAAARYAQMNLNRQKVEALAQNAAEDARKAAESYLGLAEEVPDFEPPKFLAEALEDIPEERVPWRKFVGSDGAADEVLMLTSDGGWGDDGDFFVLFEGSNVLLIRDPGTGRMGYTQVEADEVSRLISYVRDLVPANRIAHQRGNR